MLTGARNFTVDEVLRASGGSIPDELQDNANDVVQWLQAARDSLGLPILITSLYRSPARNAATPGHANNSQHMRALAADFDVIGLTNHAALARILAGVQVGAIPPYHQLITYTTDHHLHVGIAGEDWGADEQALLQTAVGEYAPLTVDALASLASSPVEQVRQLGGQAADVATAHPIVSAVVALILIAPIFGASLG